MKCQGNSQHISIHFTYFACLHICKRSFSSRLEESEYHIERNQRQIASKGPYIVSGAFHELSLNICSYLNFVMTKYSLSQVENLAPLFICSEQVSCVRKIGRMQFALCRAFQTHSLKSNSVGNKMRMSDWSLRENIRICTKICIPSWNAKVILNIYLSILLISRVYTFAKDHFHQDWKNQSTISNGISAR